MAGENNQLTDLSEIPEEILINIFKLLDRRSLLQLAQVCHTFKRISEDNNVWAEHLVLLCKSNNKPIPNNFTFKSAKNTFFELYNSQFTQLTTFNRSYSCTFFISSGISITSLALCWLLMKLLIHAQEFTKKSILNLTYQMMSYD